MKTFILGVLGVVLLAGGAMAQPVSRESSLLDRLRQLAPAQERIVPVNSCQRGWSMCERGSSQWCIPEGCSCGTMPGSWNRTPWCQR